MRGEDERSGTRCTTLGYGLVGGKDAGAVVRIDRGDEGGHGRLMDFCCDVESGTCGRSGER